MSIYNNLQKYVSDAGGGGGYVVSFWRVAQSMMAKEWQQVHDCIILNNIITLASALLCSSVLSSTCFKISVTLA